MEGSQINNHGNDGGEGKKTTPTFPKTKLYCIMRRALQGYPLAKIDEDAIDAMDRCAIEFAGMLTTAAAEECQNERRKIVSGDDLISAMEMLGFDHYAGALKEYLRRYRESKGELQPPAARVEMPPPLVIRPPRDVTDLSKVAPETVAVTGEMQETTLPQRDIVLGQQPPCDVMELGLNTNVYAVWSRAADASTSSPYAICP